MTLADTATLRFGLVVTAICAMAAGWITGCSGEPDPSDPEDAYDMYRHALFEGDGEAMWERVDEETREYFEARYTQLEEMDELIERYLPATDHDIARSQSGAELLDDVDSGSELFTAVIEPGEFIEDEAVWLGADLAELRMAQDGESAVAVTRGQQQFVLVTEDDEWYVNLVESDQILDNRFEWLDNNEDNLEQTVEDLLEEERQMREEIIADLMDVDPQQ